jgi:hypothetical protein
MVDEALQGKAVKTIQRFYLRLTLCRGTFSFVAFGWAKSWGQAGCCLLRHAAPKAGVI